MGFRAFVPVVAACPGCGRTTSTVFQELAKRIESDLAEAMPVWREKYPGVEALNVAVMGCIVNGPGESKHADIGISLPGTGEQPAAPVFIDGRKAATLRGPTLADDFRKMVAEYVERKTLRRAGAPVRSSRPNKPCQAWTPSRRGGVRARWEGASSNGVRGEPLWERRLSRPFEYPTSFILLP